MSSVRFCFVRMHESNTGRVTMVNRLLVSFLMASLGVVCDVAQAQGKDKEKEKMIDVVVRFDRAPTRVDTDRIVEARGKVGRQFKIVPAVEATIPTAALEGLRRAPGVAAVDIDGDIEGHEISNSWGVARIGCGVVHGGTFPGAVVPVLGTGVRVAVIDTGINYNHPQLGLYYQGGHDFVNNDSDPMDDHGHGTHVAGIVGALRDGVTVVGAAPEVDLYAVKVLDSSNRGNWGRVLAALDWCVTNEISIATLSLGGTSYPGSTFELAFQNAYDSGLLIIASAGNSGSGADKVAYPAKFDSVIAVASTTKSNTRSSFSSTGPAVEIAAPGSSIYSCWGSGYATKSGTSMAAPHVAGVAALVITAGIQDANGDGFINDDVRALLQLTAEDLGSTGHDPQFGHGLVDAEAAVSLAVATGE